MSHTLDPSGSHHPHGPSGGHPGADEHGHDHHHHRGGLLGVVREVFAPHSHDHTDSVDDAPFRIRRFGGNGIQSRRSRPFRRQSTLCCLCH